MKRAPQIQQTIIAWIIWSAFFTSLFFYRFFFGSESGESPTFDLFAFLMLTIPSLVCLVIRWAIIPKLRQCATRLVAMIIGLSFGESLAFFGFFLFTDLEFLFFTTSLIMVGQFAPTYVRAKSNATNEER